MCPHLIILQIKKSIKLNCLYSYRFLYKKCSISWVAYQSFIITKHIFILNKATVAGYFLALNSLHLQIGLTNLITITIGIYTMDLTFVSECETFKKLVAANIDWLIFFLCWVGFDWPDWWCTRIHFYHLFRIVLLEAWRSLLLLNCRYCISFWGKFHSLFSVTEFSVNFSGTI